MQRGRSTSAVLHRRLLCDEAISSEWQAWHIYSTFRSTRRINWRTPRRQEREHTNPRFRDDDSPGASAPVIDPSLRASAYNRRKRAELRGNSLDCVSATVRTKSGEDLALSIKAAKAEAAAAGRISAVSARSAVRRGPASLTERSSARRSGRGVLRATRSGALALLVLANLRYEGPDKSN
jgi:hypothetical protein